MFMNATGIYRIRKFQNTNFNTLFTIFFNFADRLNFLITSIATIRTKTIKIASDIPLSFAIKLFLGISGIFMADRMAFMSRDERFSIPSIVFKTKLTLAGS